ncbi:Retrovirus-related Pol polyprotein from transposon 17.6 [Gossypium australe]|uniref:Retrovirus-related Pol polyprotein from transposon 17.6 n=1 Tax=Gossypium australe TaxID=47621 RepID=A0A5B6UYK6_9ROSI|nr:Retrovirus-related Pol polyprotein from transposon 17.6 [Gossypium australe]
MANRVYVFINHLTLTYVMKKKETKARLMRWKGMKNQIANNLSEIENETKVENSKEIKETFIDKQLFKVEINQQRRITRCHGTLIM